MNYSREEWLKRFITIATRTNSCVEGFDLQEYGGSITLKVLMIYYQLIKGYKIWIVTKAYRNNAS